MCDLQGLINIEMKSKNFPRVSDSNGDCNTTVMPTVTLVILKFQKWHQLKRLNEENNNDVVKFNYGDPSVWFNWICVVCKQKALDGISLEMQYLSDNFFYTDSNGTVWFRCEKCTTSIHQHCLQFYADPQLLQKFGLIVNCCK